MSKTTQSKALRLLRATATLLVVGLVISGSYATAVKAGHDPLVIVKHQRCEAGAFISHAPNAGKVAADSDTTDDITINNLSGSTTVGKTRLVGFNLIPDPDLENLTGTNPDGWNSNLYGNNDAKFSLVEGRNGSQTGARVQIGNFTSGDADWYYNSLKVNAGGYYQFSDYYRSDVTTRAIAGLTDKSGKVTYLNLSGTPASSNWAQYSVNFFVPSNIVKAVVYHPLTAKGYLETDDYALTKAEASGFNRALVSVTFDDGWKSIHDNALPILKTYDIPSTQYIISGYLGSTKSYMTPADVYDFRDQGSEIASHTVDHPDLTKLNDEQLGYELTHSRDNLKNCFGNVTDFAEPYGTYNAKTVAAMSNNYSTARSTDAGFNTLDNTNPYELKVQNVNSTTTRAEIAAWIATAKQNNAWLILVYHQVDTDDGSYARSPNDLAADMQLIKQSSISVKTMHNAFQEVKPQLSAFSSQK